MRYSVYLLVTISGIFPKEPEKYVSLINYNFSLVKHSKQQVFFILLID